MILCKLGGTRYLYLIELGSILFYIHIYIYVMQLFVKRKILLRYGIYEVYIDNGNLLIMIAYIN